MTKAFQQTPKQRRVSLTKNKQALKSAKPIVSFEQKAKTGWDNAWRTENLAHYVGKKR